MLSVLRRFVMIGVVLRLAPSVFAQAEETISYTNDAYAFMDWFSCHEPTLWGDPGHSEAPIVKQLAKWDRELFMPADSAEEIPQFIFGIGPLRAIAGIDSLFNENELVEMEREAAEHARTGLTRNLRCLNRVKRYKGKPVYWYYWPLFSQDRNRVLFRFGYWCGKTCGYGGSYVLQRVGEAEWKVVRSLGNWMS